MNKKAVVKVLSGLPGFKKLGLFYIGMCNKDVISGYAIDAPLGGIYISRFILPTYDRNEFLHMSLGGRIAQFTRTEAAPELSKLDLLLRSDWQNFSTTCDCQSLVSYLDQENVAGEYSQWTRYLTYVRVGDFERAGRLEVQWTALPGSTRLQLISENIEVALDVRARLGWSGLQGLLTKWSEHTTGKFCR